MPPTELPENAHFDFPRDKTSSRVRIKVPKQKDNRKAKLETKAMGTAHSTGNFTMGRLIANFVLSKDTPLDPPAELTVEITSSDVNRAKGQKFTLAYWNGSSWVTLKDNIPSAAGDVTVSFAKLGDPPLAIGP